LWNLEKGLSTGDFERWMKWDLGMELLSLKRPRGDPALGTLEYMLRKSSDTGICL
jgi:hypothetical protein